MLPIISIDMREVYLPILQNANLIGLDIFHEDIVCEIEWLGPLIVALRAQNWLVLDVLGVGAPQGDGLPIMPKIDEVGFSESFILAKCAHQI